MSNEDKDLSLTSRFTDAVLNVLPNALVATNFFRTTDVKPLVIIYYTNHGTAPRQYHVFWTEDGNSVGHVALGDWMARDRFIKNCYFQSGVTVVPSKAYDRLTAVDHMDARDRAINMLKDWE